MFPFFLRFLFHIFILVAVVAASVFCVQQGLWLSFLACMVVLGVAVLNLYRMQANPFHTLYELLHYMRMHSLQETEQMDSMKGMNRRIRQELEGILDRHRQQVFDEAIRQRYYERLLDEVDTAILVCDADRTILWSNRVARGLLAGIHALPEEWIEEKPGGKPQVMVIRTGGMQREMLVSHTKFVQNGRKQIICSLRNIREILEDNQIETQKKLIRVLTHEIMNSIAPILSLSETLGQRAELLPAEMPCHYKQMQKAMNAIHRRSKGLLEFTENYRRLTRIPPPQCAWFPVDELFADLRSLFEKRGEAFPGRVSVSPDRVSVSFDKVSAFPDGASDFPGRSVSFSVDQPYPGIRLYADRGQIEQVLLNLLKNAWEASVFVSGNEEDGSETRPDVPQIRLVLRRDVHGGLLISVHDCGCGISPEAQEHIFVPFYTTKPQGSGIGLALCKQIMHLHKGNITMCSTPDRGTRFTLHFPPS